MDKQKRLLTGLQPSGALHIGNYFGSLKSFKELVEDYDTYDSYLMVAEYHALTTIKDPNILRQNIIDIVKDYIAIGIDPEKVTIFKQSDVQEHTELAWIFESLVTVPFLMQAHSYKDKVAKGLEANAGLFNYPMLMAADILLYDIDVVPIGEDQRQHLEYTREAATKFNNTYGETFKGPKELISKSIGIIPGIDGRKMSKSYGNTIPAFGNRKELEKAIMSIVTDSNSMALEISPKKYGDIVPHEITWAENIFKIHCLFIKEDEIWPLYVKNRDNYKALKEALLDDVDAFITPLRKKRASILDSDVRRILKDGAEKARARASQKMETVRRIIGVKL